MSRSYITTHLQSGLGGVQLALAAAYESRVHTLSKMTAPRAQFAGDTAVTLTDGSYNTRTAATSTDIPKSATAFLANSTNVFDNGQNNPNTIGNFTSTGKPLVIKMKKDEFNSEILEYAVFNADGSYPGAEASTPYDPNFDPWNVLDARYRVNTATGEIYLNHADGIIELRNPEGIIHFAGAGTVGRDEFAGHVAAIEGPDRGVVGMVEFEAIQGGALSLAQQQAAELSSIIASLTSVLRAQNDSKRGILNLIK
jgi:hypothetical protein